MPAMQYNLTVEQGIPFIQEFLVRKADNSLKDLSGYTARMQFRLSHSSQVVELSATTENSKLEIVGSTVKIKLTEADTAALKYLKYVYDIELVDPLYVPMRLVEGTVTLRPEVTR